MEKKTDLPTKARMTVKNEATGKVTFMLNSNICSKSTIAGKEYYYMNAIEQTDEQTSIIDV